jgi:hypothetical protein
MSGDIVPYEKLAIVPALPAGRHYPEGGEDVFRGLLGATIVRVGSTDEDGIEGGGLIIDYRTLGSREVRRVVFGFNENGMWVEYDGSLPTPAFFPE